MKINNLKPPGNILYIISILLISFLSFEAYFQDKNISKYKENINNVSNEKQIYRDIILDNLYLPQLYDQIRNKLQNNKFNENIPLVIMVVKKGQCGLCISRMIVDLIQLSDSIGPDLNIYIVGDFSTNEFNSFVNGLNPFEYLQINKLKNMVNNTNEPYVFIVKNNVPTLFFVPEVLKDMNEIYFYNIIPEFLSPSDLDQ